MTQTRLFSNEIYYMIFRSGYHDYTVIGTNLEAMYRKIIMMYNRNCRGERRENVNTFPKVVEECGSILVYAIKPDLTWFDDEYNTIESCGGRFIGDYLEIRRRNEQ